jgi:hypothetical protein
MIDVRLDTLPQDLPWSTIGRRLVCKECGAAELVRRRVRALGGAPGGFVRIGEGSVGGQFQKLSLTFSSAS